MSEDVIKFQAQIGKIQTLADGGYRLTLDLSGDNIEAVTALLGAKAPGVLLEVAALPVKVSRTF